MVWLDIFIWISFFILALIDLVTRYIYNAHIFFTMLLICISLIGSDYFSHFLGVSAGFAAGYTMYKISYLYYKQEAFGFGDVLLLSILGLYFGWPNFFAYFTICYLLIGAVITVPIILKPALLKASVPMAPFYITAGFIYKLWNCPSLYKAFEDCLHFIR